MGPLFSVVRERRRDPSARYTPRRIRRERPVIAALGWESKAANAPRRSIVCGLWSGAAATRMRTHLGSCQIRLSARRRPSSGTSGTRQAGKGRRKRRAGGHPSQPAPASQGRADSATQLTAAAATSHFHFPPACPSARPPVTRNEVGRSTQPNRTLRRLDRLTRGTPPRLRLCTRRHLHTLRNISPTKGN